MVDNSSSSEPAHVTTAYVTPHATGAGSGDAATALHGDCGVVVHVEVPCPDGGLGLLRCGCGAEIYPSVTGVACDS